MDLLDEILVVPELRLHKGNALLQQLLVERHLIANGLCHPHGGLERAEVEGRAHAIGTPEFDVVGVVVRLHEHAQVVGIPGLDAIIEALLHLGPETPQPHLITADAPLTIGLHNTAQLAIGGGVEVVRR